MEPDDILNALEENNPFSSSSAGDPWESAFPHVESINKHPFDGLCRLIRQKRANPALNTAALILGEAGSGKTHLIGRILKYGKYSDSPFAFAYIQPIEDPGQTFRYLLREIMINICYPSTEAAEGMNQLERLLATIFREYLEKRWYLTTEKKYLRFMDLIRREPTEIFNPSKITTEALNHVAIQSLHMLNLEYFFFPEYFLKVLFQYRDKQRRTACINWLKGIIIDQEASRMLDIAGREKKSEASMEQESRDLLIALGTLLARYDQPLVICFDRLENLDSPEKMHSLGKMIEFLVDTVRAMLPITCCRGDLWEQKFQRQLNEHVVTRLNNNRFVLEGCNEKQAMEIVKKRLFFVLGDHPYDEVYPFDHAVLSHAFKDEIQSPREVITQANQLLREILGKKQRHTPSITDQFQDAYQRQYNKILSRLDRYPPDRQRLGRALELFFQTLTKDSGYEIHRLKRRKNRTDPFDFSCRIGSPETAYFIDAVLIIDMDAHHLSVGKTIQKGLDFLSEHPEGKVFYIRDSRCRIPALPKWPTTNALLQKLKDHGGTTIFLNERQIAAFNALALMAYAVKEGDITVTERHGHIRSATVDEFIEFIRQRLQGGHEPVFMDFHRKIRSMIEKTELHSDVDEGQLANKIVKILMPVSMLSSQKLVESINRAGCCIDLKTLLNVINKNRQRFEIIHSRDGLSIMLKKDWLYGEN